MNKNICSLCGKEYDFSVSVKIDENGVKTCIHDRLSPDKFFSEHEKKIKQKLPKGQKMIKGKDGISRICETGSN
jgi:hypothetical protein